MNDALSKAMYGYVIFCIVFHTTIAVEPPYYNPALDGGNELSRNELIEKYFHMRLQAAEILGFIVTALTFMVLR